MDEAAVVVDPKRGLASSIFFSSSFSFFSSSFPSSFFSVEEAVAPKENPVVVLEVEEVAPPKLKPPEDAAEEESAFFVSVVDAVPKPNDDAAGAAPKLNAPVAPALGAAGASAGVFPAALSRSSWRAFCAALYPALALARNAALNPPALGAAGLGSSFLGSSFLTSSSFLGSSFFSSAGLPVVIAGGAKLNPPAVGLLSDVAEAPDPPKLNPAELPELEKLNVEVAGLDSVFAPRPKEGASLAAADADDDAGAPNENDGALPIFRAKAERCPWCCRRRRRRIPRRS